MGGGGGGGAAKAEKVGGLGLRKKGRHWFRLLLAFVDPHVSDMPIV